MDLCRRRPDARVSPRRPYFHGLRGTPRVKVPVPTPAPEKCRCKLLVIHNEDVIGPTRHSRVCGWVKVRGSEPKRRPSSHPDPPSPVPVDDDS